MGGNTVSSKVPEPPPAGPTKLAELLFLVREPPDQSFAWLYTPARRFDRTAAETPCSSLGEEFVAASTVKLDAEAEALAAEEATDVVMGVEVL